MNDHSNFLVIDFDYFFPTPEPFTKEYLSLYDWSMREAQFFIETIWPSRASVFLANDLPLPRAEGYENFIDRFRFTDGVEFYAGESNSMAANVLFNEYDFRSVWLYDAHHDAGYSVKDPDEMTREGIYSCEDWMVLYWGKGCDLHVRYPKWRAWAMNAEPEPLVSVDRKVDDGRNGPHVEFDAVFICRSGAWVPSWCDDQFFEFIDSIPHDVTDIGRGAYPLRDRGFSLEQAQQMADNAKKLRSTQ